MRGFGNPHRNGHFRAVLRGEDDEALRRHGAGHVAGKGMDGRPAVIDDLLRPFGPLAQMHGAIRPEIDPAGGADEGLRLTERKVLIEPETEQGARMEPSCRSERFC